MNLTIEDQEYIFEFYGVELYEQISSPLPGREDSNPSFSTKLYGDRIKWSDFGAGLIGKSVIDFVMQMENANFKKAISKIRLILDGIEKVENSDTPQVKKRKSEHTINVIHTTKFEKFELNYWKERGIGLKQLEESLTFPLRILKVDGKFASTSTPDNPKFVYYLGGHIGDSFKVYSPFDKDFKWISNRLDLVDYETPTQNKYKDLIVLSSRKDCLVFNNYNLEFDTTSSLSESNFSGIIRQLDKDFKKYDRIFSLFDFDEKGIEFSNKLYQDSNFKIKPIILGNVLNYLHMVGIKDIDNLKTHQDSELEKIVVDEIKSTTR